MINVANLKTTQLYLYSSNMSTCVYNLSVQHISQTNQTNSHINSALSSEHMSMSINVNRGFI